MGISISYSLALRRPEDLQAVLAAARDFAINSGWQVHPHGSGLLLAPHAECEDIVLSPGSMGVLEGNVKTQFAGPAVHVQVVSLLAHLEPLVSTLEVVDDSGYWESRDDAALHESFASEAALIADARRRVAEGPAFHALKYWFRIVGLCVGVFIGVVALVLAFLWLKARIGA